MKFGEFMAKLQQGEPKHIYLLAGEEHYYIDKAQERILGQLFSNEQELNDSLQKINGDIDSDDLISLIDTAPFFTSKNVLMIQNASIFRETKKGSAESEGKKATGKDKKMERLLAAFADMPSYSYIIFVSSDKADKRRKVYKTVEKYGAVLEAEAIRAWNINDWLQGKLQSMNRDMDRDAYAYFNGAVSMMQQISLEFLDREFDKLALFSQDRRITKATLTKVFAGLPEVSIFALMDAISERNGRRALMLLRRQLADGTYFTVILSLLTRHVRQLWQARILQAKGIRGKALAKPLELNPFIAEKLGRAAARFPEETLKQAMLELIDADYWLKTGQAGEAILEHTVIRLCGQEN